MKHCKWAWTDIPRRVLRVILLLTAVVFIAFFLIGYAHPYPENPDFIEPRLTDVLMGFTLLIVLVAIALAMGAVLLSLRKRNASQQEDNKLPTKGIAIGVVGLTAITMVVALLLGSTSSMKVNGADFDDPTWLRAADMFVLSAIILMVVATALVALATIRTHLKNKRK